MDLNGFDLFRKISFGTSFDPKNCKRRNKLKNYKRNKRKRAENVENSDGSNSEQESSSECKNPQIEISKNETPKRSKKKPKVMSALKLSKIRKDEVIHFRRVHRIRVTGSDIPDPIETFKQLVTDYKVNSMIFDNISKLGYSTPTPIQMQTISLLLHNRQILACAPTGSGKTAAFLIPIIHNLQGPRDVGIRAVILAPTRELVKQIYNFCTSLSEGTNLRTMIIKSVKTVKADPSCVANQDILISTPNRLIYLLQNSPPLISLNNVQWLVVDECDKLFQEGQTGFREQLAVIYKACDSAKKAMFSATFSQDVQQWCALQIDSLVGVFIGTLNTAVESVKQELMFVGCEGGKLLALRDLIRKGLMPPVLIFVQSKERACELYNELVYDNIHLGVIHADLSQEERDKAVQNFTNGKIWILICTDLLGRGIDFKAINMVINYDFPQTAISYIHRIGRAGRAGESGKAITYFTTDDVHNLRSIAQVIKNTGCEVPDYIMKLKKTKKKNEILRTVKREKISTVPNWELEKKQGKKEFYNNMRKPKWKGKNEKKNV